MKKYIRDGRSPIPEKEITSKIMSAIRSKNTKPEQLLVETLTEYGLKNFKQHANDLPGKPDICFYDKKIAIFVHGCFWHGCPHCKLKLPKTHTFFWKNKIEQNIKRDSNKKQELIAKGWKVKEIWECELKEDRITIALDINNLYYDIY